MKFKKMISFVLAISVLACLSVGMAVYAAEQGGEPQAGPEETYLESVQEERTDMKPEKRPIAELENEGGEASAEPQAAEAVEVSCESVDDILNTYFNLRERALSPVAEASESMFSDALSTLSVNEELIERELVRKETAVRNLAIMDGIYILDVETSFHVNNMEEIEPGVFILDIYEWNWITYTGENGGWEDEMGYAVGHTLTIQKQEEESYQILNDVNDESDFLGDSACDTIGEWTDVEEGEIN